MDETTPWPRLRTASTEHLNICSPMPDANTLPDGAICRNVERLEQSAEELSQGGSDIGEEIRKLQAESRRSSLASRTSPTRPAPATATATNPVSNTNFNVNAHPHPHPLPSLPTDTRSRGASTSSYSNSIVDLNREARWGGYSPGAFIGSPTASIKSGTWQPAAVVHRTTSNAMSISTRREPVQEGRPLDSPLASPSAFSRQTSHASLSGSVGKHDPASFSRRSSQASRRLSNGSVISHSQPITTQQMDEQDQILGQHQGQDQYHDQDHINTMQESDHVADTLPTDVPQTEGDKLEHADEPTSQPMLQRSNSNDTYRQASALFKDFDGVHFSPTHEEFIATDDQGNIVGRIPLEEASEVMLQQDLARVQNQRVSFAPPVPLDNMVFYPAPVPRILNLPKKLSSRPVSTAFVNSRSRASLMPGGRSESRNTLAIGAMDFERANQQSPQDPNMQDEDGDATDLAPLRSESPTRPSTLQQRSSVASLNRLSNLPPQLQQRSSMASINRLSNMPPQIQQRSSMASLNRISNMPPQLRASMFFDHPSERQSVNIQSDSAVATLESILQASANAPVSVFTDHPIVGRAGANVYAKERPLAKRSQSKPLIAEAKNTEARPRRQSASGILENRTTDYSDPNLARRNSVMSLLTDLGTHEGKKLQKRSSRLSLGSQDLLKDGVDARGEPLAPSAFLEGLEAQAYGEDGAEYHDDEYDEEEEEADMGPVYAQPTTLLAELQMRKAQQKSRNRTAATAFPNGMHATLLELDAVAQIESRKRKNHKVALAWEDPGEQAAEEDAADEDIPLAALYPAKNGLARRNPGESEWDRPIGLMERRQMEDNEPLSRRRNRLLGIDPRAASRMTLGPEPSPSGSISPAAETDPEDDLPLAERRRRMKQRAALDSALGEVSRDSKSTFEAEVLSVLGVPTPEKSSVNADKENGEETLGQRRARLQREKSGLTVPAVPSNSEALNRPALRQSMSLANLLGSAPLDPSSERTDRRNVKSPAPTTLLGQHQVDAEAHKTQLMEHNARKTSHQETLARLQRPESQMYNHPPPGQLDSQGQVSGLINAAGGGVTGLNRRTSYGGIQPSASMPGLHSMNLQSKVQAGLAQQGQMMNPLAFTNFVPPAPVTGLGFNGGMSAAPMSYAPMMPGYGMVGMQQTASMPYGFGPNPLMGYGNGMIGMQPGMGMGYNGAMGYGYNPMGAAGGYGMMSPEGMNPAQRDTIDRWRSSVAP